MKYEDKVIKALIIVTVSTFVIFVAVMVDLAGLMPIKESILSIVLIALLVWFCRMFIKYPEYFKNGNKRKH